MGIFLLFFFALLLPWKLKASNLNFSLSKKDDNSNYFRLNTPSFEISDKDHLVMGMRKQQRVILDFNAMLIMLMLVLRREKKNLKTIKHWQNNIEICKFPPTAYIHKRKRTYKFTTRGENLRRKPQYSSPQTHHQLKTLKYKDVVLKSIRWIKHIHPQSC